MSFSATPLLAIDILQLEQELTAQTGSRNQFQTHRCRTRQKAIDNALNGGFACGHLVAITTEAQAAINEIVQAVVASSLIAEDNASVHVITSGSSHLKIQQLYKSLMDCLTGSERDRSARAAQLLDQVKIMTVFDFLGLTEAISEIRDSYNVVDQRPASKSVQDLIVPLATIPDSDDEDDLLDLSSSLVANAADPATESESTNENASPPRQGLVIINNLTQLIMPLIKNNYVNGQAMLTSFLRSLSQLTKRRNLCTILFDNAALSKAAADENTESMFEACTMRPSLGPSLGTIVDMHIYLHTMPRGTLTSREIANTVNVFEIVQDRYGGRVGRCAFFDVDQFGGLVDAVL